MNKLFNIKKLFLTLSIILTFMTNNVLANTIFENEISNNEVSMSFENNKISIDIPENINIDFIEYNIVKLTDLETRKTEILPSNAVDMNGKMLNLSYVKTKNGLDIYPSYNERWGWWDGVKCISGVLGSIGAGAIGGASVGTITIPGVGTISGTILSSVSGGLVGIASFC